MDPLLKVRVPFPGEVTFEKTPSWFFLVKSIAVVEPLTTEFIFPASK